MEEQQQKELWLAGFWRRVGAFILDLLVLAGAGLVLGFALGDVFADMGNWAKLIGFVIFLAYFGLANSHTGNGQTFGKKVLKIQVVDKHNATIPVSRAVGRASVIAVPYFLNGLQVPNLPDAMGNVLSVIVFGGLLSIFYLAAFNRRTRQSLHDIVSGTYVVNVGTQPVTLQAVWKPHFAVVGALLVASLFAPALIMNMVPSSAIGSLDQLSATQQRVNQFTAIRYSGVTDGSTTVSSVSNGTNTTHYIRVEAYPYNKQDVQNQTLAERIALMVFDSVDAAVERDVILVQLIHGYDIGIASSWVSHQFSFSPTQLSQIRNNIQSRD
ncbi:RDD family protein [Alteromonas sp. CYL-A6]|uniref:RDD family protein n=1 Tax=Alteromonas nitratireducens TaxID=3390813 RepID=UPI0034A84163